MTRVATMMRVSMQGGQGQPRVQRRISCSQYLNMGEDGDDDCNPDQAYDETWSLER